MEISAFPWLETSINQTVSLRNIFLHVTKACNLYCQYCYFSASKPLPNEMNRDDFDQLWPEILALQPKKVVFTGGEPLLRPDILDLLGGLRKVDTGHVVQSCLNTNGHLFTKELAQQLIGLVDEVRVSIDGMQERNDTLRNEGNFDAVMQALETCYVVGFEPKVLITVTSYSLPDLERLLGFLLEHRITKININLFRPIGRGKGQWDWIVNPQNVFEILTRVWTQFFPSRSPQEELLQTKMQLNCGVGQFLNIMPNGDVFPCHVLTDQTFRCGNVRDQSLLNICHKQGLLGQLADLNFHDLSQEDNSLVALTQPHSCLGNVYPKTKTSSIWKKTLPGANIPS